MIRPSHRSVSLFLTALLVLPTLGLVLSPAAAAEEGDDIRIVAVYRDFGSIPSDEAFLAAGLSPGYRFTAIPAIILSGASSSVEGLRNDFALSQIVYDEPLEFLIETAVAATKARDVWGSEWHRNAPAPMLKDGQPLDGRGVTVGIVDSGANALHPDLWYAPFALADGVTPAPKIKSCVHTTGILGPTITLPTPDCDENVGHGTHVAGIVAGTGMMADMGLSARGVTDYNGAAPGAQLVVAGLGVETIALGGLIIDGLAGLDYMYDTAEEFGIRVVTNSWSSTSYNCNPAAWRNDGDVYHAIVNKLIQDKGITVLWASNNAGGTRPIGTSPQARNTMPGNIMVANYDDRGMGTRDGDIAASSGDGCVQGGAANTQSLLWTWPDVAAPGTAIVSTASGIDGVIGQVPIFVGSNPADAPFYTTLTGTSMATPHVAGVVALMYQAYPEITPAQVEKILIETATPWADGVSTRNVTGSQVFWGSNAVNNAVAGFADPTLCRISPTIAARAEANDATLDALYPGFRDMVQPRLVNGQLVDVDANLYVCRDFKRGHGLIDAEAAVRAALRLAGDGGEGEPAITIDTPQPGEVIDETQLLVEGLVDRTGATENEPPTAALGASVTSGPAPLEVAFSLGGADADGVIASFSLDYGDGSAPLEGTELPAGTQSHTYTVEGPYTATLTVTDNDGASADASVSITVGGFPATNPDLTAQVFAYNHVMDTPPGSPTGVPCPGISNVIALGTGPAGDEVPKYPPGSRVCVSARSIVDNDLDIVIDGTSTATFRIFDSDGDVAFGPVVATVYPERDTTGALTGAYGFRAPNTDLPATWLGRFYLAFAVDTPDGPSYLTDRSLTLGGHKAIDVGVAAPELGSEGPADEGHSIGDADNDGTFPTTEIEWVDTAVDADTFTSVIKLTQVPPQPAGDSPFLYNVFVNGLRIESYILVGHGLWDSTSGQAVEGGQSVWDVATNTVTIRIPRAYLASVGADCPCVGHYEAMAGEGQLGGLVTMDRAPDSGTRELRAGWQIPGISSADGSSADPENEDAAGDSLLPLPHLDVRKAWVSRESATEVDITISVADLASAPPSVDVGVARLASNYGAELCVDNADATYTATSGNYAGVTGMVCYRLGANTGPLGTLHSAHSIQADGSAGCSNPGLSKAVAFNTAASTVTWTLELAKLDVSTIGANLAACTATPPAHDARFPGPGTKILRLVGSTGVSVGAGVIATQPTDSMTAANARPYELGAAPPLVATAGSGYSGDIGESIAITGSATGGTPPYSCAWSGPEGTFADAAACSTSVVFSSAGAKTITLTVTDADGTTAADSASVDVLSDLVERVEVVVGGVRTSSAPVTTSSAAPAAAWSTSVDLSGLPDGEMDLVATWYDTDGTTVLATATRTIELRLGGVVAMVDILTPASGSEVSGVSAVTGTAGHTTASGGAPATSAGLNHYGLPLASGLHGGRASVELEGEILLPCAACEPGELQKPVAQIPDPVWDPLADNAEPVLFNNLATSAAWLDGPDSDAQGLDGYWFNVAGHGGDAFELTEEFEVIVDIRFYNDWLDPQSAELGGVNGHFMPKSGTIPQTANWAFVYARKGTDAFEVANQWLVVPHLSITPTIVPPGAVQELGATSGPGTVALTWSAPINDGGELLGYKVMRDGADLATVSTPGHVDTPGDTVAHVYAVIPFNSAGDGPTAAISATAGAPEQDVAITKPLDGAVGVSAATTIEGTYTPATSGGTGGSSAFANTHYVALLNLNSNCGGNLGYGDHVILEKLSDHAIDVLGMPANNLHVFNENGGALSSSIDASNYNKLGSDWKSGAVFDGPARWSVFAPALRQIAATAAAGEAAGGPPARIFFVESSHGLHASLLLGDGATDSLFCLQDADVSSTMLGDLLNDIDADVADAHEGIAIEWAINIDCSFCGGFADRPLPMPGTSAVHTAGVIGPNRVVEVGCTWVTECFGNPAVTYDYMFNECVFTGKADGYGPRLLDTDVAVGDPAYATPDGVITLEESYWCAIETARESVTDPIAIQQMFQLDDQLTSDMFGLGGFPIWEKDSSLDLAEQDPASPLDTSELGLPDVRVTDPSGDGITPFSDLVGLQAQVAVDEVVAELAVADLTLSSLEAEDEVIYLLHVNGDQYVGCYFLGEAILWGSDIESTDPISGEESTGAFSAGSVTFDTANGIVRFRIPTFELNDATLPAQVYGESFIGDCGFSATLGQADDRVPDSGTIQTSEDDDTIVTPVTEKIVVTLTGPGSIAAEATLDAAAGTWTLDPPGELAEGLWSATATQYRDEGTGFVQHGAAASISFRVGVTGDVTAPTAPGTPTVTAKTTNSIEIAWTASSDDVGVDRYEVLRDGAPVGTTAGTSFVDAGLAADTAYTYVVEAYDAAGNSAQSSPLVARTLASSEPVGFVTLRIGDALLGSAEVDLSTGDPADWSIEVDWATLPTGEATLVAEYDDGEGLTASDSIQVVITRGVEIEITSPLPSEHVLPTFTVSGTVEGAGGPDGVDASTYLFPTGALDPMHLGYALAQRTSVLQQLDAALNAHPGYLGVAPALDGSPSVLAYFTGSAPAAPADVLPSGWTLEMVEDVQLERALLTYPADVPDHRVREGPPVPAQSMGIGPGSHLIMNRPDGTFGCTANFVWKDTAGKYYLGAAGHCFLPSGKTTTHGVGQDYDPALTRVRVCVEGCAFGGQVGFLITGTMVQLGQVAYARQTGSGGAVGNDFGLVEIPLSLYDKVKPEMPVWNGPTQEGALSLGEPALVYGNAVAFGETWPTMARAGFGSAFQSARSWSAVLPSAPGDSGSALLSGVATAPGETLIEGFEAVGTLTHLSALGPVVGTTMPRSKLLAAEAGLTIEPVLQGQVVAPPEPTVPGAPMLGTLTPGATTMELSWTPPANDGHSPITGYTIRYGTAAGIYEATQTVGAVTSATVEGLAPTTEYHFVVAATNAIGTGPDSNEASAMTTALPLPPGAPLNVAAVPDNSKVIVTWDAPESDGGSPITGYVVSYTGNQSGTLALGAAARVAEITGLVNGQTYEFTVAAQNEVGTGEASAPVSATPNGPPPPDFRVEVRADAGGIEVLPWTVADSFDGSSFAHEIIDAPGGALAVTARVLMDGSEVSRHAVDVHVLSAPVLSVPASVSGNEKQVVQFTATATDADGPNGLTFSLVDAPQGATIGPSSGEFSWTPEYGDAGIRTIGVRVTDPDGLSDVEQVELDIGAANRPPVLDSIGNRVVGEGELLSFTATASDHEGDPLTFSATPLPAGATMDSSTGEFAWTPPFGAEGNHEVTFSVSDGLQSDAETIIISVGNVNRPPTLGAIGDQVVAEDQLLALTLLASDPDATDTLTFSATGLPAGATFSSAGALLWLPSYTDAGSYPVTFTVTDGDLSDSESIVITVTNVDRAPTLAPIPPASVLQLSTVRIPLRASDPDAGDGFAWSVNGAPGATIEDAGDGSATFVWTPTLEQLGPHTFTVIVRSGPDELVASRDVTVTALFKTAFTLAHESSSAISGSPGETVTIRARITNTGPQNDTFGLSLGLASAFWKHTSLPSSVTLAPGESVVLSANVIVPTNQAISYATVGAISQGDGTTVRSARFRLDVPVVVELSGFDHLTNAIDVPRGTVTITHLDGTPAVGAVVSVSQMPPTLGGNFRTTASGFADAKGEFHFDFSDDPRAMTPGHHQIVVVAKKPNGFETTLVSRYDVGPRVI